MPQGDKRLVLNVRERLLSDDFNRLQGIAAAERAALLRSAFNDALGDWFAAGGLQTPYASSNPSLVGDVYGGLMVQPDNAGYFLVQGGVAGFLDPAAVGVEENPYRVVNDPGVSVPAALPFTSNAGGGSPRWDVVECQPADALLSQESRYVFNPATGIASPILVDKVRAGRLTYRVRIGTVGAGFPGLAVGWMPLAVVCAPAGSSSLLTSDVWDVRPLVRERVRPNPLVLGPNQSNCPILSSEYRHITAVDAAFNQWVGASEAVFNGYQVGGKLERSTPSTLAQFGSTAASGGRAGVINADLADNKSTFALTAGGLVYVAALFPAGLPRWQRYSQLPIGLGRVPSGPRGILVVTTATPLANGLFAALPLPTASTFGGSAPGCALATVACNSFPIPQHAWANSTVHWVASLPRAGTVGGGGGTFNLTPGQDFPPFARSIFVRFEIFGNHSGGPTNGLVTGTTRVGSSVGVPFFNDHVAMFANVSCTVSFSAWVPVLPRLTPNDPALPAVQSIVLVAAFTGAISSVTMTVLAWNASDR